LAGSITFQYQINASLELRAEGYRRVAAAILLGWIFAVDAVHRHNELCCYENNERWSKACWAGLENRALGQAELR
jgi:hypothetical protein